MAVVIHPNMSQHDMFPEDKEKGFTLKELYRVIGTEIVEKVILTDGSQMIVDEEGLLKNRTENVVASMIALRRIVGTVVICSSEEFK